MNFGSLEKIESVILRPSKGFIIKNVVVFGSRDKLGKREDAFREISYKSSKYSNLDFVGGDSIETQDFLVFAFTEKNNENKLNKEEIFISYPHIYKLKELLEKVYVEYCENEVFKKNKKGIPYVTAEYEEYLETVEFIGNRSIGLMFDVKEIYDENIGISEYKECMTFLFNDEQLYSSVDVDTFYYIYRFIEEFNLLQSSQNLINLAFMNEMAKCLHLENKKAPNEAKGGRVVRKIKGRKEIEETNKAKEEMLGSTLGKYDDDPREEIPFEEIT